jgi:hypothetical protein
MPGQASSRSLPGRPNLRHLKLEAKRRLAGGEFPTLHEAQMAIAREHGLPSWAVLKRHISENQDGHALDQLRWIISRFAGADEPGWTAPADDELNQHFDDRLLAALPPSALIAAIGRIATDLRDGPGPIQPEPQQKRGITCTSHTRPAPSSRSSTSRPSRLRSGTP